MTLSLTSQTTLEEISRVMAFNFPYLKLMFFDQASGKETSLDPGISATAYQAHREQETCDIHFWESTAMTEDRLSRWLGLRVKLFRKSASGWMETTGSKLLSLEEQNSWGRREALSAGNTC